MNITINEVQLRAWANKLARGLSAETVMEFALAYGELGEAFDAYRKHPEKLGEELADVLIFLTAIATLNDIDLGEAVAAKLAINESRTYVRNSHGFLEKEIPS